jgi:pimeloyl-ACP methyl ester carboxylesterase
MIVLVHGAWHDASCWAAVESELAALGEPSMAVDLPASDPTVGAAGSAEVVLDAIGTRAPEARVVLVGHSLGGLTVPVVAAALGPQRVRAVVLVAALVPRPGMSYNEQVRADGSIMAAGFGAGQRRNTDGSTWWPADAAAAGLYRGVAEEVPKALVDRAVATLRPQAWTVGREITPLVAWPAVRTVSVVCAGDQVVNPEWARRAAAEIGAEVVELPGGHFPMLTRPAELAALLAGIARA